MTDLPTMLPEGQHRQPRRIGRRQFLAGAAVTAGLGVAALVEQPWHAWSGAGAPSAGGPLVLVTMYGGNDGLNTVIPVDDPAYHAARPTLGYQADQTLPLPDGLALNGKLTGLKRLWDAGQLAIVRGVGYPDSSLSHFESMDIWQTANPPDGSGTGWLGRWLDATGTDPMRAISVGSTLPPALRGERSAASAVVADTVTIGGNPAFQTALASLTGAGPDRGTLAATVARSGNDLLAVRRDLDRLHTGRAAPTAPAGAPRDLTGQLGVVADLIRAGAPTRVYQVSLSSFDTHSDERADQERLLAELDAGLSSFLTSLHGTAHGAGTVVATYSEFGRRPAENASGGTDHGTAAPLFVAGPTVKGGQFYGDQPSLSRLDPNGNLVFTVDFRSVYATLLDRVVGVDPSAFLGGRYPTLDLV